MTPLQAIYAKCLECCCQQITEVHLCPAKKCPLYEFHTKVKKPRQMSEEAREKARQRMIQFHQNK